MRKPVLIIDTREKNPWNFDDDEAFDSVVYEKLDVGDYSIRGLEHVIAVERKVGADELFNNFGKKAAKERIFAEFDRMSDHKLKLLVIESSSEMIMNPQAYYVIQKRVTKLQNRQVPAVVMSNLTELMLKHNVQVIFGGDKAQSITRGILLRAWQLYQDDVSL